MSAGDALIVIREWYDRVKLASLELPTRAFAGGRGLYRLTNLSAMGDRLLIELEGQLFLAITNPAQPLVDGDLLVIEHFSQAVLDWQEFGTKRSHTEVFTEGAIRFRA